MKKIIILGLFSLALLPTAPVLGGTINTVLVTTNQLDIPYNGTYAAKNLVKLGNYTLPWTQAGKSADIFATLPTNLPAGTYALTLQGSTAVSVEIGSVTAAAALNVRMDAEAARAGNAEAGVANSLNAEATRATATEAGLTNGINAETTRAENAEADLANTINATSNNIISNFGNNLNSISNSVSAGVASNFNAASNNIAAGLASYFNSTSNGIVASLTKNIMTAYSFGSHTVNAFDSINFSSFIGDWTTNGTAFKIPATGVYQINFSINTAGFIFLSDTGSANFRVDIQISDTNDANTNGLGYFSFYPNFYGTALNNNAAGYVSEYYLGELSGQTTVQCNQGDMISINSIKNAPNFGYTYGNSVPTNVPSATLSIIQIQ